MDARASIEKKRIKNIEIHSSDIPLIYFNLFEIQSHSTSLLAIMGLEQYKIDSIEHSYVSDSMRLVNGFNKLFNYFSGKRKFTWFDIYEAIIILGRAKKEKNDVHAAEKLFQCGAKIQQKMI